MDLVSAIGKNLVGGIIALVVFGLLAGIFVDLPGLVVLSLLSKKEYDPDNLIDVDPTGIKSRIVGILLWVAAVGAGYVIFQFAK